MVNPTKHPLYKTWTGIKNRCYNQRNKDYPKYGGRGITICDRWKDSFDTFVREVGERPSPEHSIERLDNNGNYGPGNCIWGTPVQQSRNRRTFTTNTSGTTGVHYHTRAKKWQARIYANGKRIHGGYFDSKEDAIKARIKLTAENWSN